MLKLRTLVEQIETEGQYYDLGVDYTQFKHSMDSSVDDLKRKIEGKINQFLKGKRVLANASRGYKQYQKSYEFDVNNITIEDRYGNYVVIAHDMTVSKPKEYYLNTGKKIKILGQATGQPSPQKGVNPATIKQQEVPSDSSNNNHPVNNSSDSNQHKIPALNPQISHIKEEEKDVNVSKNYEAYSIFDITEDIKPWLPFLLKKQETPLKDLVKKIGWTDHKEHGVVVSVFELKIPSDMLRFQLDNKGLQNLFFNKAPLLKLVKLEENKKEQYWDLIIKKVYREK